MLYHFRRLFLLLAIVMFPFVASGYSKPRKLLADSMSWRLASSTFPDPNAARTFTQTALRVWQTYGGATLSLSVAGLEPLSPVVDTSDGVNVIFYDPAIAGCGGGTIARATYLGSPVTACDIVVCQWGEARFLGYALVHEVGHCLGFGHSNAEVAVMRAVIQPRSMFLQEDDVNGLYAAPAYQRRSNAIQTQFSADNGVTWNVLSAQAGGVASAATRKTDVAPRQTTNRYAIAYSDTSDRVRVLVGDGNQVVDSNVDTGADSFSGPGIAWNPVGNVLVVAYRQKSSTVFYARRSTNSGATWSGWNQVIAGGTVGATVDVGWSPVRNLFYAVGEDPETGEIRIGSSADGTNWTARSTSGAPSTAGGVSIACSSNSATCILGVSSPANMNTQFRQMNLNLNDPITFSGCCGGVTDGVWSAGEVEAALRDGEADIGAYGFRGEASANAFGRWLGTFDGLTGTVRQFAEPSDWGPQGLTWGAYYTEFFHVVAR